MIDPIEYLDERNSYIVPAILNPKFSCGKCRGTKNGTYTLYWNCSSNQDPTHNPDHLGIGIFAQAGEQAGSIMRRYKDPQSQQLEARIVVQCLAVLGIASAARFEPDVVTTIPSLCSRLGVHQLHVLTNRAAKLVNPTLKVENLLFPGQNIADPRSTTPSNFAVAKGQSLVGKKVLLVDDTWVSGGHFRSATAALKNAGASQVIGLAIARWLKAGNKNEEEAILRHAAAGHTSFRDYDFFH